MSFFRMMASVFNLEAVDAMAGAAALGGLRHACKISGLTHDGAPTTSTARLSQYAVFHTWHPRQ